MMSSIRVITLTSLVIIVLICTIPYLVYKVVYAERVVEVNPTCGPASPGFNMNVNANGFKSNDNVKWNLVNSMGQIPLYGYFQTNDTGGFSDVTFADDLRPDNYKMNFGDLDDVKNPQVYSPSVTVDITIPCVSGQQPGPSIASANYTASDIILLSQRYKMGDGAYDNVVGEVKNIGNETAKSVRIDLTTYDNNGGVLGTDYTYGTVETLKPGQKSSFDLSSSKDNFKGMDHYELSLQWRDTAGIDQYVENAQVNKNQK